MWSFLFSNCKRFFFLTFYIGKRPIILCSYLLQYLIKDLADNNDTLTTIDNDAINNSVHNLDILHQTEQIKKDEEKEQKDNVFFHNYCDNYSVLMYSVEIQPYDIKIRAQYPHPLGPIFFHEITNCIIIFAWLWQVFCFNSPPPNKWNLIIMSRRM